MKHFALIGPSGLASMQFHFLGLDRPMNREQHSFFFEDVQFHKINIYATIFGHSFIFVFPPAN